jgi:1-acyl-sn-glycerol-3-phosphate acyltransferase
LPSARQVSADATRRKGAILPRVQEAPRPSWLYSAIAAVSWPVLKAAFRLRVKGVENVPRTGGFVLAANHLSNFDPWPLGIPLFPRRFLRFMAKSELFWFPLSWIAYAGGAFPVRRGERDEEAIARAVSLCRDGHAVVMFPEGTRRKKGMRKKHEARWRTGAARIALEAGVPLVPAAVAGTDRLARLAPLRVRYGAPLELGDLNGAEDAPRIATERLQAAIEELEEALA